MDRLNLWTGGDALLHGSTAQLVTQSAHDFRDVVFLKNANPGNAHGASFEAGMSVLKRDAAQRQHGNLLLTSFTQCVETGRTDARSVSFFEHRGKHCEVSAFRGCAGDIRNGVTRYAEKRASLCRPL